MPAYCRETHTCDVRWLETVATVARAMATHTATHGNFRRSEELQQRLQRSQRGRLHVDSLLLQFDGAQSLFELPHQVILKTRASAELGAELDWPHTVFPFS